MNFGVVKEPIILIYTPALLDLLFCVPEIWKMALEILSPEVPSTVWVTFETKHTKLIARSNTGPQELKRYRGIRRLCDTFKILTSFREADDHI